MITSLDLVSFRKQLSGKSHNSPKFVPGVFKAIEAGLDGESNCVNWNSFTLEEAMIAMDEAYNYCDSDYMDEAYLKNPNKDNVIHQYLHNRNAVRRLKISNPVKQTEAIQFF